MALIASVAPKAPVAPAAPAAQAAPASVAPGVSAAQSAPVAPAAPAANTTNSSVIEKTLNNPTLGSTLKKRKVASECRRVKSELDGVLEKYYETLACILLLFKGIDAEKAKVSETISEVVNLVMDAHGVKKGVTDLLLPTTYQELLKSMCVPDLVLLYFKLQAKLPDAVWQTLLNLTQLGRSGVSLTL